MATPVSLQSQVQHYKGLSSTFRVEDFIKHIEWGGWYHRKAARFSFNPAELYNAPLCLLSLKSSLENIFNISISAAFVNYYQNGNDYTPYHADKYGMGILTVSLGDTRDFYFKDNQTKVVTKYKLDHGDVMIFSDSINHTHKHSVPKRTRQIKPRVSILFFY